METMGEASIYERVRAGERPLYFAHVPKTAGTSFYAVLDNYFAADQICPWNTPDFLESEPREQWQGYQLYRGHFGWLLHELLEQEPWMITMMRDPLQREISAIHHGMRDVEMRKHLPATLCEFVRLPDAPGRMAKAYRDFLAKNVRGTTDEWIHSAKQALDDCVFVGLTERFDDSMALLAYKLGWWPSEHVEPHNVKPKVQRDAIPEDTLAILREAVGPTYELYEHSVARFERDLRDMHADLLSRHYREQTMHAPRSDRLLLRFDEAIRGSGWHAIEPLTRQLGLPMRWTGPGNESRLHLKLRTDRALSLQIHIGSAVHEDVLSSLTLHVNGVPVPMSLRPISGRQVVATAELSPAVLRRDPCETVLSLRVASTRSWQQIDPTCDDTLPRGIAVCQLKVEPSPVAAGC